MGQLTETNGMTLVQDAVDMGWKMQGSMVKAPITKKVALVGHSPSSRLDAPFDDPTVEIWTMNDAHGFLQDRRVDRWFEIHPRTLYSDPARRAGGFMEHLAAFKGPIYMREPEPAFPTSVKYPMEAMFAKYGEGVFGSSFAYLIALAVEEGFTHISMWGCDLASESEYRKQRESTAFWIGYCRGKGITFELPAVTPILKALPYGQGRQVVRGITEEVMNTRIKQHSQEQQQLGAQINLKVGAIQEAIWWRAYLAEHIENQPTAGEQLAAG